MKIEALIKYLQIMQTQHPGLEVICPMPHDQSVLTSAMGIVIGNVDSFNLFGSLIGISQEEIAKMKILKETTPPDQKTGLRNFNAGDVLD
jgi:hypothetical protein